MSASGSAKRPARGLPSGSRPNTTRVGAGSIILLAPFGFEGNAVAQAKNRAVAAVAARAIVDLMAVALVEPVLGAEPPDRVLHEARKVGGEGRIELPGVDRAGDLFDDLGAAAGRIAGGAIRMSRVELSEDAGA